MIMFIFFEFASKGADNQSTRCNFFSDFKCAWGAMDREYGTFAWQTKLAAEGETIVT